MCVGDDVLGFVVQSLGVFWVRMMVFCVLLMSFVGFVDDVLDV